jgi:small-conductance mechanosensitive channel
VIISDVKGDIKDITLIHIFLNEIGGTIDGEEKSGRTVMLPTLIIFDEEVINYTEKDEYILDDVTVAVTYESNLEKAEKITIESVKK